MTDDLRFAQMMREDASALPPPEKINPWQMAMTQVLWGFGLSTITLNFLYLDYILPALGAVLLVLGFRTLRRENRPLRWCYILSIAKLLVCAAGDVLAALPVKVELPGAYISTAVTLVLYICLWRGMVEVSRAAGAEKPAAPAAGAMALFYALLLPLALIGLQGWLLVMPILIVYAAILRNMWKLTRSMENMGYAITAAPVRLPGWAVLWGSLAAMLAAVLLTAFLGQRYPMDWQPRQDAPQDASIRQSLLEKGFPADVLDDLTADEVAQLSGAVRVYHQTERLYSNTDYREVTLSRFLRDPPHTLQYDHTLTETDDAGNRTYRYVYRVYDTLEQTMRHVAVEIPAEGDTARFVYIHHLTYDTQPSPRLTEALELWPAYQFRDSWAPGGAVSGRLLCERSGGEQTAPFYSLTGGSQQITDIFGTRWEQQITALWTRPAHAEKIRAYVFYDALRLEDSWVIESWANYVCQTAPVYPFRDAAALWHSYGSDAYSLRQTALQVFDG